MIYVVIIGLSAFLLFQVQPMMAKIILPTFGGGAFIWLTCIIFFQLLLLGGYSACHFVVKKGGIRGNFWFQLAIVLLSLLFLPLAVPVEFIQNLSLHPSAGILLLLFVSVGLPYFVLSTTSPTLQYWIARDRRKRESNPYLQYAVSNGGSLIGLLIYPFLIETTLANSQQTHWWSVGYVLYLGLLLYAMFRLWPQIKEMKEKALLKKEEEKEMTDENVEEEKEEDLEEDREGLPRGRWLMYSMIPSAALLVVTHYLTVDIVNFPLLWVLPLALYLLSFVVVFAFPGLSQPGIWREILLCFFLVGILALRYEVDKKFYEIDSFLSQVSLACAYLFALCFYFHGNLEREKPAKEKLTAFYFYLSLGSCIGSIFVGILAPLIFRSTFEFELVIFAALAAMFLPEFPRGRLRNLVALAILLMALSFFYHKEFQWKDEIIYRGRSFYGTYNVASRYYFKKGKISETRALYSGTTLHGGHATDEKGQYQPITYYTPPSALGQYFEKFKGQNQVAVVGLGTGVIALYGEKGERFDFFEIDPLVEEIAWKYFGNLKASQANIEIYLGDARLELRKIPDNTYDLLVLDAFSSDAIPSHLVTEEAVEEYLRILKPGGVILYHISNRYVDLWPVLNGIASRLDLQIRYHNAPENEKKYYFEADWVALTGSKKTLLKLIGDNSRWKKKNDQKVYWTDDFNSLWPVLNLFR